MTKTRILVVDDDLSIVKLLRANLTDKGYEVVTAMDGAEALQKVEMEPPNLIILDIKMPKIDGVEVCRQLREWSQVPIIMVSSLGNEEDKVECLVLGADDYMTKPFGTNELIARVNAVMRRTQTALTSPTQSSFSCGEFEINFVERRVTVAGREAKLTPTEYNLLQELVLNSNKVLTHTYLLNKIWGPEYRDEKHYVHIFVGRLRKVLESDPVNPRYILTIPGVGYRFEASR